MNIESSKKGWIVTKYGRPLGTPETTKHSMLVGYDMMPLRGLRKAEKALRTHPYNIRRVVLEYDKNRRLYGAAIDGRISLKFAAFSNISDSIERTKSRTAFGLLAYKYKASDEEYGTLSSFYYLWRDKKDIRLARDKRCKGRLLRLRLETERIFAKLNIVFVPVKYVLVS